MVNKRTREIFGSGMRTTKNYAIAGVIVALVFLVALAFAPERRNVAPVTTQAVIQTSTEGAGEQKEPVGEANQDALPGKEEKEKAYYQYGGRCSFEVRHAEDDVHDVNSYLEKYQQEHDTVQEEYDEKRQALDQEYLPQLDALAKNIATSLDHLKTAEKALEGIRAACEP